MGKRESGLPCFFYSGHLLVVIFSWRSIKCIQLYFVEDCRQPGIQMAFLSFFISRRLFHSGRHKRRSNLRSKKWKCVPCISALLLWSVKLHVIHYFISLWLPPFSFWHIRMLLLLEMHLLLMSHKLHFVYVLDPFIDFVSTFFLSWTQHESYFSNKQTNKKVHSAWKGKRSKISSWKKLWSYNIHKNVHNALLLSWK